MEKREAVLEAKQLASESRDYYQAFDESMQSAGFTYVGGKCTCDDEGIHGHQSECGWERKPSL